MTNTSFTTLIDQYNWDEVTRNIYACTASDVERALGKDRLDINDFMALISPAAEPFLEQMARKSQLFTQQRFGKTQHFYIPLYLTNACINHCVYCGFNHKNEIKRIILTEEEIEQELQAIKKIGPFEHILLVTGESPREAGVEYLEKAIKLTRKYFSSVDLEVQPLKEEEYTRLIEAGLNSVYCYQETYNKVTYPEYHPRGKKHFFDWRLDTYDRLGRAGINRMGLGVLIGLEDWRTDTTMMATHLAYLRKKYWRTKYSISFPRMRPYAEARFQPNVIMKDKELAQLIFAFRLFDHDIELSLSTRESSEYRDNMVALGITNMSAGSKTDPGGYVTYPSALEQFSVNDDRTPDEIEKEIRKAGYDVIWKDWDRW